MATPAGDHPFTPDLFVRLDETDDSVFYSTPRKVVHLDDGAVAAVSRFYSEILPPHGKILDLMASWRSHLPVELPRQRVVGLGMNAEEMSDNPDLDEWVVHDLNKEPELPFSDAEFDGAVLSVSVQYLVKPIDVFRSVARILRPRAPFVVSISHRCFPTKTVKIWQRCQNMRERMELGMAYFSFAGGFMEVQGVDLRPGARPEQDPLLAIFGKREGDAKAVRRTTAGWHRR